MKTEARIITDYMSEAGNRLTTMEIRFPRIILPEMNTHRILSKSTSSTRAISLAAQIREVQQSPFIPSVWTKNSKRMHGVEIVDDPDKVEEMWNKARLAAVDMAWELSLAGLHKQYAAHVISPYAWTVMTVSGTSWKNVIDLRTHWTAHPEFIKLASLMRNVLEDNKPAEVKTAYASMPYIAEDERRNLDAHKVSVARCARRSYGENKSHNWEDDLDLHDRLLEEKHMTPFEHVAYALPDDTMSGNFKGWMQYRKTIPGESGE